MKPEIILKIIAAVLLNPTLRDWLYAQAKKTESPIDEKILDIIYKLISEQK